MLDNKKGVPFVAQAFEDFDKSSGIARMEAHTGFIQNKKRVNERGPQTSCEVHPLDFSTGKGTRRAIEGEVAESDLAKVVDPREHLGMNQLRAVVSGRKF